MSKPSPALRTAQAFACSSFASRFTQAYPILFRSMSDLKASILVLTSDSESPKNSTNTSPPGLPCMNSI